MKLRAIFAIAILGIPSTYELKASIPTSFDLIEFDFGSDGTVDYVATSLEGARIGLTSSGGFNSLTLRVKLIDGTVVWTTKKQFYAADTLQFFDFIEGIYQRVSSRLTSGQIDLAMNLFTRTVRESNRQQFLAAGAGLPNLVSSFGTVTSAEIGESIASLLMTRSEAGGAFGYFIHLIRDGDGIWRIDGM